jgi:soluble lytic murein transglycosylase-like protein
MRINKIIVIMLTIILLFISFLTIINSCFTTKGDKKELSKIEFYYITINNKMVVDTVFLCSRVFSLSPDLIFAIAKTESRFNPKAINYNENGSIDKGVMQLNSYSFPHLSDKELYDIEYNIIIGSKHFAELMKEFDGNQLLSICAYNCGSWTVKNNKVPTKTLVYANKVMNNKMKFEFQYERSK